MVPKTGFQGKTLWCPNISFDSLRPDRSPGPVRAQHSQMDFVVETSDALMCPVFPQLGQDVTESIRPITREERSVRLPKRLPRSTGVA